MKRTISYSEVQMATQNGNMVPYFQTVHCADNQACIGVEILARITDPVHGIISPSAFLTVLESPELALSAADCVMKGAVSELVSMRHLLPGDFCVSFNVGAVLLNTPGLAELCNELVSNLGQGITLCAELTERQPFYHDVEEERCICSLRRAGVKVVLDDFGMGHSDLLMLSRYDIDGIKIPRELIGSDTPDAKSDAIERHIINVARELSIDITAEGITSVEQYQRLKNRGVNFMQGYLFSEPVCAEEFKCLLM